MQLDSCTICFYICIYYEITNIQLLKQIILQLPKTDKETCLCGHKWEGFYALRNTCLCS